MKKALIGLTSAFVASLSFGADNDAPRVLAEAGTDGATVIVAKTLDGSETFSVATDTVVSNLTLTAASKVSIAEGKTLTVDKLYGSSVLTKEGAGGLVFGEGCPTGNVVVLQGALSVIGLGLPPPLPSFASAAAIHLDATDGDSLVFSDGTTAGMRNVTEWRDTRGGSHPFAKKVTDANRPGAKLPYLNHTAFANADVIDFGSKGYAAPTMDFSSAISVAEAFLVVNAEGTDVPVLNDGAYNSNGSWQKNQWGSAALRNGLVEYDGVAAAYTDAYPKGFHVMHIRPTAAVSATSFARMATTFGGCKIGEVIIFSSKLTDADAKTMKSYLAHKWQIAAQLKSLSVMPGASVAVNGGKSLSVDSLAMLDPLEALAGKAPDELSNAKIHLDASDTTTFTYSGDVTSKGYKRVNKWTDVRGGTRPSAVRSGSLAMPYVNTTALDGGVAILDFDVAGWGTATLSFSESISVAEAFIVVKDAANSQSIINDTNGNGNWQHNDWASGYLTGGLTEVDGVATTYAADYPAGLHVFHYKPTKALSVAAMVRRDTWYGGMQIAEMVLFTSAVSTDAAARINTYLKTKWTNTGIWGTARNLGVTADVAEGSALKASTVKEAAKFAKTGAGEMSVVNSSTTSGYAVSGGRLSFDGYGAAGAVPSFVTQNASLHLDASAESSFTYSGETTASGCKRLSKWSDVRGSAYPSAVEVDTTKFAAAKKPFVRKTEFASGAVVDFGVSNGEACSLTISATLSVADAFFVVTESIARPYVNYDQWNGTYYDNSYWQRNQWADSKLRGGVVTVDGEVAPYATYSARNGFHVVRIKLTSALYANNIARQASSYGGIEVAEMILFQEARTDAEATELCAYLKRKWQRCDVGSLSFDADTEVAVDDYKLVNVESVVQPTDGKVTLGAGSAIVLPTDATIGSVASAGGSVNSDLTMADGFVLEVPDLERPLKVAGALTLPSTGTFRIDGKISFEGRAKTFVLAEAGSVVATDMSGWQVVATPAKYGYRLSVKDNKILMDVTKGGLAIVIR